MAGEWHGHGLLRVNRPLTFYRPTFTFTHAHGKTPLEINCTYLGNRKFTAVVRYAYNLFSIPKNAIISEFYLFLFK